MEYFLSLLPMHILIATGYYVFFAVFFFLMWFFKRPISVVIDRNYWPPMLHAWYWFSCFMSMVHYALISTGQRSNGEGICTVFFILGTAVYIFLLVTPLIQKLRSKIPDVRGH